MQTLSMGLAAMPPRLGSALAEMRWRLVPPPAASEYRALLDSTAAQGDDPETAARRAWAREQLARIETDGRLPSSVGLRLHGVQLANRVRLIGLEAEVVSELGLLIRDAYREGVTFALGCTNGARMYLPASAMLYEGGYEVTSYFEYHQPAPLGKGIEHVLRRGLEELRRAGVGGP